MDNFNTKLFKYLGVSATGLLGYVVHKILSIIFDVEDTTLYQIYKDFSDDLRRVYRVMTLDTFTMKIEILECMLNFYGINKR